MKRLVISVLLAISLIGQFPIAAIANQTTSSETEKIFISDDYTNTNPRRTRGTCREVYSAGWCNAHGYGNNRPVPGRVPLTDAELNCVNKAFGSLAKALAKGLVTLSPTKAVIGTARFSFQMYRCIF